jgi:hypothetical protein
MIWDEAMSIRTFELTRLVLERSEPVKMSEAEFNEIDDAKTAVMEAVFIEQKFDTVVENYLELETCFLDATARIMLLGNQDYQWFQTERNLYNRRFVNLLSACRSYLDRCEPHVTTMKLRDDAAHQVSLRKSQHYDTCFGYRLMEAIRNFVQHRGFPIHAVAYPSRTLGEGQHERIEFSLSPYIKADYLASDEKFKGLILQELTQRGGRINLKPLIRDYVSALADVHELLRHISKDRLQMCQNILLQAIDKFQAVNPNVESVVGLAAVAKENGTPVRSVPIFKDLLDYQGEMERKNSNLRNLRLRYVSGNWTDE